MARVILSFLVIVNAASITAQQSAYHSLFGGVLNVTANLLAVDKGFSNAQTNISPAGVNCTSPVTFGVLPGTANTAITAGHIVYDLQVNTTSLTLSLTNHCFTVTLTLSQTATIFIATGMAVLAGETIDCKFDVGLALPTSPFTFQMTLQ